MDDREAPLCSSSSPPFAPKEEEEEVWVVWRRGREGRKGCFGTKSRRRNLYLFTFIAFLPESAGAAWSVFSFAVAERGGKVTHCRSSKKEVQVSEKSVVCKRASFFFLPSSEVTNGVSRAASCFSFLLSSSPQLLFFLFFLTVAV